MDGIKDFISRNRKIILVVVLVLLIILLIFLLIRNNKKPKTPETDNVVEEVNNGESAYPAKINQDKDGSALIEIDGSNMAGFTWKAEAVQEYENVTLTAVSEKDDKASYKVTAQNPGDYIYRFTRINPSDALDIVCVLQITLHFTQDAEGKAVYVNGSIKEETSSKMIWSGDEPAAVKYTYSQNGTEFSIDVYSVNNEFTFVNENTEKFSDNLYYIFSEIDEETPVIRVDLAPLNAEENCETAITFNFLHVDLDELKKEYNKYKDVTDYTGIKGKNHRGEELEGIDYVMYLQTAIETYTAIYEERGEEAFAAYELKLKVKYNDGVFTVEQL